MIVTKGLAECLVFIRGNTVYYILRLSDRVRLSAWHRVCLFWVIRYIYSFIVMQGSTERWSPGLMFPRPTAVQEAALVLIKEKTGKFISLRVGLLTYH